jgi:predicted nucleic acid-binding protein
MAQIIISDTSCLILYDKIGRFDILQATFDHIIVTEEVASEYGDLPGWIEVKSLKNRKQYDELRLELGRGEASSIAFAIENSESLLIIDERKGRKRAEELGISIIGSLGVLLKAKEKGAIDSVSQIMEDINKTDFRISEAIKKKLLEEAGE